MAASENNEEQQLCEGFANICYNDFADIVNDLAISKQCIETHLRCN